MSTESPSQTIGSGPRASRRLTVSGLQTGGVPAPVGIAAVCLAALVLVDALLRHESGITGDERFYERMATHPGGPHNFPYAYRVGLPWLVHVLPFSHVVSFTGLAWLAIAAGAGALYALLREFEIPERLAAAFAIGFALSPALLVVLLRHGRSVDPAVILVLTLGCLFVVRRRMLALAVTVLLGVTVHESCLFLIPFAYAWWARRPLDLEALGYTAAIAALPVAVYVWLRASIAAPGVQYIPGYSGPFLDARFDILRQGFSSGNWQQELRRLATAFGPLWLLAPFALGFSRFARRGLVLALLCVVSMTFAFAWGRIIFFAAPVFYVAAAQVVRHRRRLAIAAIIALFALDVGYAVYMQVYGVRHGIDLSIRMTRAVPVY